MLELLADPKARIGGSPAELKGLAHVWGASGEDSMFLLVRTAIQMGFFDLVPLVNRWPIPMDLVAETTPEHKEKVYVEWGLEERERFFDRQLQRDIVLVGMPRGGLVDLAKYLANRQQPWLQDGSFKSLPFNSMTQEERANRMKYNRYLVSAYGRPVSSDLFGIPFVPGADGLCRSAYGKQGD